MNSNPRQQLIRNLLCLSLSLEMNLYTLNSKTPNLNSYTTDSHPETSDPMTVLGLGLSNVYGDTFMTTS